MTPLRLASKHFTCGPTHFCLVQGNPQGLPTIVRHGFSVFRDPPKMATVSLPDTQMAQPPVQLRCAPSAHKAHAGLACPNPCPTTAAPRSNGGNGDNLYIQLSNLGEAWCNCGAYIQLSNLELVWGVEMELRRLRQSPPPGFAN